MHSNRSIWILATMAGVILASVPGVGMEVTGTVGLNPVEDGSCVAVRVAVDDQHALAGVRWYHNDGTVTFPAILVSGGTSDNPGSAATAVTAVQGVGGGSSSWTEAWFTDAYGSDAGVLYVIFRFPVGSVYVRDGCGGGAGLGCGPEGIPGWISLEGEEWYPLAASAGVAVEPILTARDAQTVVLEQAAKAVSGKPDQVDGERVPLVTALHPPYPNPFNPRTRFDFTLATAQQVELRIYDLQGRVVRTLASGLYAAGAHELWWYGKDDQGRNCASGLYLARWRTRELQQVHHLMLVR